MARHLEPKEDRGESRPLEGESKEFLCSLTAPEETESYAPVSHKKVIDTIEFELKEKGFQILNSGFRSSNSGDRAVGIYQFIEPSEDNSEPDRLIRSIAFRNSYDKTMALGIFSGAMVAVCSNGMYQGDITFIKKHRAEVKNEMEVAVKTQLEDIDEEFTKFQEFRTAMKESFLSENISAQILGRLIFNEDILRSTQINLIKNQQRFSKHFSGNSAWDLYNNVTESLKLSNPILFHKHHVITHKLFNEVILGQ